MSVKLVARGMLRGFPFGGLRRGVKGGFCGKRRGRGDADEVSVLHGRHARQRARGAKVDLGQLRSVRWAAEDLPVKHPGP